MPVDKPLKADAGSRDSLEWSGGFFFPMSVCLPCASSSLRWEAASSHGRQAHWGGDWPFAAYSVSRQGGCVDPDNRLRLTHLRVILVAGRLEKSSLANEIRSSDTTPGRKQQAAHRHPNLVKELRMAVRELEVFLAATKQAETSEHLH
jgi:hypothetical protein